jgi:hypothetical protein
VKLFKELGRMFSPGEQTRKWKGILITSQFEINFSFTSLPIWSKESICHFLLYLIITLFLPTAPTERLRKTNSLGKRRRESWLIHPFIFHSFSLLWKELQRPVILSSSPYKILKVRKCKAKCLIQFFQLRATSRI